MSLYRTGGAIQQQLIGGGWKYYFIELSDVAIGYLRLEYKDERLFLADKYVFANQRNTGAARATMELINSRAATKSVSSIELFVNISNNQVINFYKKWGFSTIEKISNTYESGHTKIDFLMQKQLEISRCHFERALKCPLVTFFTIQIYLN